MCVYTRPYLGGSYVCGRPKLHVREAEAQMRVLAARHWPRRPGESEALARTEQHVPVSPDGKSIYPRP